MILELTVMCPFSEGIIWPLKTILTTRVGIFKTLVKIQYVFLHLNFSHIFPNLCDRFNEWYLLARVADTLNRLSINTNGLDDPWADCNAGQVFFKKGGVGPPGFTNTLV